MGFFGHDDTNERQAYEQFQSTPPRAKHEGAFSHELIAGAASFEAMRAYEKHEQQNGKPENFMLAKELIAGFAGAEVDKLIETKGLNEIDALRAKHEAKENAAHALAQSQQYGNVPYSREIYGGVQGDYGNQEYGGQPGYGGPPGPGGGYGPPGGFGGPGGGYAGQGQGYGEGGVGYGPPGGGYEGQGGGGYGPPGGRYGGPPQGGYGGPPGGGYGGQGGGGPPGPGGGYGPEGGFGGPGGGFPGQGEGHHHRHHERREEY